MSLKTFVRNHLLTRNYYLAKLGYYLIFYINSFGEQPLLVYQMGKVGSSTIVESLRASRLDRRIYHLHYLTRERIEKDERLYYGRSHKFFRKSLLPTTEHLFISQCLRKRIELGGLSTKKKWKIVTMVRDPIARNISGFFEGITLRIPDFYERFRANSIDIDELVHAFFDKYEFHEVPLMWFDTELEPIFGIDVFSSDFPKTQGYKIYEGSQADVLLLRLESMNDCSRNAFSEYLDIQDFTLKPANVSSRKEYYPIYKELLASIVIPPYYIDEMYDSKYTRHFYTEDEINIFTARWSKQ